MWFDEEDTDSTGFADWLFAAFILALSGALAMVLHPIIARLS